MVLPNWLKGSLLVLLGAFLWGTLVTVTKGAAHLKPLTVATVRVALSAACGFLWFGLRSPALLRIERRDLNWVWFFGGLSAASLYGGFTVALRHLSVATTEVIFYTFPLFTSLGGAILLKERPTVVQIVSGLLILSGVACMAILSDSDAQHSYSLVGIGTAVLSVFGMTAQSLLSRWNGREKRLPPWTLFTWGQLFCFFWLTLAKTLFEGWGDVAAISPASWALLLYMGVIATFVGYGVYNMGLVHVSAATGSMLASFEMVTAVALTALFLGTIPSRGELLGCCIILAALFMSARGARANA